MNPQAICPCCQKSSGRGTTLQFYSVPRAAYYEWPEQPPQKLPEPGPELRALEGSVIGYRGWDIDDWQLCGTGVSVAWEPGINQAVCKNGWGKGNHLAPAEGCDCGLYALARFDENVHWWSGDKVLGAVEAWADADEHNHDRFFIHGTGFRAQYAKVILLAVGDDYPRAKNGAIRALAAEYGADVCQRSHLEDAAKEHGQLVPDELLEWAKEGEPEEASGGGYRRAFGGGSVLPTWFTQPVYTVSSYSTPLLTRPSFPKPKPKPGRKGIKQTLGYPGPPADPTSKHRKGDRVRDSKGQVWQCTKGGKPGMWEAESSD